MLSKKKLIPTLILSLVCILSFVLRIPSFTFPLDYDVGGHLFNGMCVAGNGFYSAFHGLRSVGILAIFALIYKVFGSSTVWVNVVGAIFWTFSTFFVFKIAEEVFNSKKVAGFSSLIFALLSSNRSLQGEMANMETFFISFSLLGVYFFFSYKRKEKRGLLVLSGLFFGVAFLIKQLAAFDFLAILSFNLFLTFFAKPNLSKLKRRVRPFIAVNIFLVSGFLAVILLTSLYFWSNDQLKDFFFWQFIESRRYVESHPPIEAFSNLRNNFIPIFAKTYPLWLLALLGMLFTLIVRRGVRKCFLFFWVLLVFLGMFYLWWFFPHHFLQLTPPVSILAGLFLSDLSDLGKGKLSRPWLVVKDEFLIVVLLLSSGLVLRADSSYFSGYFQKLNREISQKEYLAAVGFDTGPDGWLPFYEAADCLGQNTKPEETIYVWSSVPTLYALMEKNPISWFSYNYLLLPDELRSSTTRGRFADFERNREKLMGDLNREFPDYIIIDVMPEKIFDEMMSFDEFSRFVYQNYEFGKHIGRFLLYKKKIGMVESRGENTHQIVPLEIVKRYAAITEIITREGKTEVSFEPLVNPDGILRRFYVVYPEILEIVFEPLEAKLLGQDGEDFVTAVSLERSGVLDLHVRADNVHKPVSFVRVKTGGLVWTNEPYGVNRLLKVLVKNGAIDFYFEPPVAWKEKEFELYLIFEDGTLARGKL